MQLFSSSSREYEDRSYTLPQEFLVPDEYETRDGIPTTSSLDADDAHATAGAINDSDDEKRNWFRGITVYKDFFLSAFADAYCCGEEGFFPGGFSMPTYNRRVAPVDLSSRSVRQCPSSTHSSRSPSFDSRRSGRRKPLGVAVGYNYAEGMNGRKVIITPNSRRTPAPPSPSRTEKKHDRDWIAPPPTTLNTASGASLLFSSRSFTVDFTAQEEKSPVGYTLSY